MNNLPSNPISEEKALTFRLFLNVQFNKAVEENDSVSVGSFTFEFNGQPIQFDFEDLCGGRLKEDNSIVRFELKNPDYNTFPESMVLTNEMLKNVTGIEEIFTYTEEGWFEGNKESGDNYLHPTGVIEASFVVINDSTDENVLEAIPIPILTGWKFPN